MTALTAQQLEPLAELLAALTQDEYRCYWIGVFPIGAAGNVQIAIDVIPRLLDDHDRDFILSTVAQLTNWQAQR